MGIGVDTWSSGGVSFLAKILFVLIVLTLPPVSMLSILGVPYWITRPILARHINRTPSQRFSVGDLMALVMVLQIGMGAALWVPLELVGQLILGFLFAFVGLVGWFFGVAQLNRAEVTRWQRRMVFLVVVAPTACWIGLAAFATGIALSLLSSSIALGELSADATIWPLGFASGLLAAATLLRMLTSWVVDERNQQFPARN